jgi:hypothetical protein
MESLRKMAMKKDSISYCMSCGRGKLCSNYEQCRLVRRYHPKTGQVLRNEYIYNGDLFKDID